jgi:hypothetical protein
VAAVRPNIVGVQARVVAGDQLHITNLARAPVVIFNGDGQPLRTIPPGQSDSWHDPRVVESRDPPPPRPGAAADEPRFVKNWRVPGRAGRRAFAIEGFLGWIPPADEPDNGSPRLWALAAGALALVALSGVALVLLGRRSDRAPNST